MGIARHFDGSPGVPGGGGGTPPLDYILGPNSSNSFNGFTWAAWVYRDFSSATRNALTGRLFAANNGWSVFVDEGNNWCLRIDSTTTAVACPDLYTGWRYLAVTYDPFASSDQVKFYYGSNHHDIALIGTGTCSGTFTELSTYGVIVGWITFGNDAAGGPLNSWNGGLDLVQVWFGALTLAEIKASSYCDADVRPDILDFRLPLNGVNPEPSFVQSGGGFAVPGPGWSVVGTTIISGPSVGCDLLELIGCEVICEAGNVGVPGVAPPGGESQLITWF